MADRIIRLRNALAEVARLDREVAALLGAHGAGRDSIRNINLGLEEVVTNIIKYAYEEDAAEHWIEVRLSFRPAEVQIVVADEGRPFDPLQHPEPDPDQPLEHRQPGGLGISFFRRLFDDLQYRREDGKNVLVLRKAFA